MTRPLASSTLCGLAAWTLALGACRSGGGAALGDDPAVAAIQARIPPLPATEVGAAPGFLAGGVVYLAMRPGQVQRWLQSLPLGPDVVRDLARAGNELGLDPRVDDVSARLGIDPDALISATLFRPLGDPAPVRALLQSGAVLPPDPFPGLTPSDIGPLPRDYDRMQPPPVPPPVKVEPVPVYQPPPPVQQVPPVQPVLPVQPIAQQKPTAEQGELVRRAASLGTHSRVHVPVKDLALMLAPLRRLADKSRAPELERLCGQLGPSDLCTGGSSELLVIRSAAGAVAIDFFDFPSRIGDHTDPARLASVQQALNAPISSLAPLSTLRGEFAVYVDADALPAVHEVYTLTGAVSSLRWSPEGVQGRLRAGPAITALRETRRLFAGVRLEVSIADDTLQANFQWQPRDDEARAQITRLLTRSPAAASVPTIAGLCDGGLACLRTAGLPALAGFQELAIGVYARPESEVSQTLSDADGFAALVIMLETWPNLLGAVQRWPKEQSGRMETVMLGQAIEAIGRIEGLGGSLRSLHVDARGGGTTGDYVGYARLQGQDLALIRSLMGLAGIRFSPVTLANLPARVESAALPDAGAAASLYLVTDPGTVRAGDRDLEVGWAMLADSTDRLTWMFGLERSAAVQPAFYLELPDLWQLLGSADEARDELNFAQGWLTGRSLRLAGDLVDGRPSVRLQLARVAAAP